jgi:hypothetical protein
MLFTPPPPPLSSQSVSSSVENDSSPTHTASVFNTRNVENQLNPISLSNNATLVTNGPSNNQLLSTSQSLFFSLPDQDYFYSPSSSSSSSRPSIHLTPTNFEVSKSTRRDSYPVSPVPKKINRFHFPTNITSSIRDALMASMPNPDSNMYHTEDKSHSSKANLWSNNTLMPVANPTAAAALIDDNEMVTNNEQLTKSDTSSPLNTPKNSENLTRSPTVCSVNLHPPNINNNRKVILNVGGVRHEGNLFIYLFFLTNIYYLDVSIYSFMAYTFSSSKYTSRSFG